MGPRKVPVDEIRHAGVILSFLYRYREALTGLGKSVTMAARVGVFTITASVATGYVPLPSVRLFFLFPDSFVRVGLLWTFASRVEGQFELLISASKSLFPDKENIHKSVNYGSHFYCHWHGNGSFVIRREDPLVA